MAGKPTDPRAPGFNVKSERYEQLLKKYKRMANTADKRMLSLEKLSEEKGFTNIKKWAYNDAINDIRKWSGEGRTRWSTKAPESTQGLLAKIKDIDRFLHAPSASKRSIVNLYQQEADTINDRYGLDLDWEDMGKFFESKIWEKLARMYGSKTAVKMIGSIQKSGMTKRQIRKEMKSNDFRISDEAEVNHLLSEALGDINFAELERLGVL